MKHKNIGRVVGGVLLVSGTTIGAGMLGMPVSTGFSGFYPSLILFVICWLIMLATAFFFLHVNLSVRGEPNLISMAGKTLGTWGKAVSWVVYLLLLYSLLAAYISASGPIFSNAIPILPPWLAPFCLPLVFGAFVYLGTIGVDYVNRVLMTGLIIAYIVLVSLAPAHIHGNYLLHVDFPALAIAVPVVFTAFGYHIIIPSLSTYLKHDAVELKWTIVIGSTIPLIIYFLWQLLVLGVVPLDMLTKAWVEGEPATAPLAQILESRWLSIGAQCFSFFAIVTSFLGVALSLSDFLVDGFRIKKTWEGRLLAWGLTFMPPLFFVYTYQRGFYIALQHAGALVAILLGFLPAAMAWKLKKPKFYRSTIGRVLLVFVMVVSLSVVVLDVLLDRGLSNSLISAYVSTSN